MPCLLVQFVDHVLHVVRHSGRAIGLRHQRLHSHRDAAEQEEPDARHGDPEALRAFRESVDAVAGRAERGAGAMVEDVDGNRFLDCAAGIAVNSTGHSHPEVVRTVTENSRTLKFTSQGFEVE